MKKYFLLLLTLCMLLSGCVSQKTVDFDRAAATKFGDYLCFSVESRDMRGDLQDLLLSPIVDRRIEKAIKLTLLSKGFSDSCPEVDFRVSFGTVSKTRTRAINVDIGSSPFRRQAHLRFGGYSRVDLDKYEEGGPLSSMSLISRVISLFGGVPTQSASAGTLQAARKYERS